MDLQLEAGRRCLREITDGWSYANESNSDVAIMPKTR